jgi:hypothetical protein
MTVGRSCQRSDLPGYWNDLGGHQVAGSVSGQQVEIPAAFCANQDILKTVAVEISSG